MNVEIEIMIGNRRENPQLSSFAGELYTAFPTVVEKKVVLSVWLDYLTNVNSMLVTHEIGHWVLKLQGFHGMIYQPKKHCDMEILLNSLVQHPPLYALQRSLGHEPQIEIDLRANHNIKISSYSRETGGRQLWVNNALLLADDLINCSDEERKKLMEAVSEKHPNTRRLIEKVLDAVPYYDLLNAEQNLRFTKRIIKNLELKGTWNAPDELKELVSMVNKALKTS
jgi:hypothetical protein